MEVPWEAVRSNLNKETERPMLLLMGMAVCDDDQLSLQLCLFSLEKSQKILEVSETRKSISIFDHYYIMDICEVHFFCYLNISTGHGHSFFY